MNYFQFKFQVPCLTNSLPQYYHTFPKKFIWLFSSSYISGETIEDAIRVSKELNSKKVKVTLDVLGEFIKNLDEAEANKKEYLDTIDFTQ